MQVSLIFIDAHSLQWDPSKLDLETDFVLGVNVNKYGMHVIATAVGINNKSNNYITLPSFAFTEHWDMLLIGVRCTIFIQSCSR